MRSPIRWMTWTLGVTLGVIPACKSPESTEVPDDGDTAALERLEARDPANPAPAAGATAPVAAGKAKPVPTVRDRDPEEERKKLALSHERSAQAAKHLAGGRFVEAIDHCRQALKIHEQNVEAMLVMGEAYYRQQKFELVQAVTSSALAVDEKVRTGQETSRAHNLKGFAYVQMGQDNLATQAFRMAAEADEKNASAWNNLGTRYMQAGDIATAKQCFGYALELDPRFAKAHVNIGAALRADGKLEDAEKSLQVALKLRPNYPEAYFNLGLLYLDAEPYPGLETTARLEKAIGYLTKYRELAIADGPEGPSAAGTKKGPKVAFGPAAVSQARADDYIRVAKKGIDREQRRVEREKTRSEKPVEPAPKPPATVDDPAEPATADAAPNGGGLTGEGQGDPPANPAPTKPLTPTKPGGKPSTTTPPDAAAPSPSTPSTPSPSTPSPSTPSPTKPSPVTPSPAPATPTPIAKPAPAKPTAQSPAAKPVAPTPIAKPTEAPKTAAPSPSPPVSPPKSSPPSAPPPTQPPTPSAKPAAPAPQKPAVQKPGAPKSAAYCDRRSTPAPDDPVSAAGNPRRCVDTHALAHARRPTQRTTPVTT